MTKFSRFTMLTLIVALVLVPMAGFAQTSRTTGALIGTVTDTTGAPLPGVTVTVTSPVLQGPRSAITDAKGEYVLPLLPPGAYHADFALAGIQSVVRDNVQVGLGQSSKVDVTMKMAVTETVTVSANAVVVDPTQVVQQQNFKQDHLKYAVIGSANRSYQNVLQQAAGVAGGSNPQVAGANSAQNNWMLDGINTTDPVTHTFGNNLAFDAIQEISIQTLGKDAEYSSSGGTINVITKSGGNAFSGTGDWRYNDTHFQSQGKETQPTGIAYYGATPTGSKLRFDKNLQPTKSSQPAVTLGGPIMRDRLWFFGALARPDTATTPPVTNPTGIIPGTRTFKGWNNLGKLTLTPVANQTLTGVFIDSYAVIPHVENSSNYSAEAGAIQHQKSRTYGLTYDAILTSKWLANVQVGHTPASLSVGSLAGNVVGTDNLTVSPNAFTGAYSNQQGRTSYRNELQANTTYYLEQFGTHAFKVGGDFNKTNFTNFDNNYPGDPSTLPSWNPALCGAAVGFPTGTTCKAYLFNVGSPDLILEVSPTRPPYSVGSKQTAFFAQDEWNPVTRLTVRAGVRRERVTWETPAGNSVPPTFSQWQPRLGLAYDIFNNASSVVHGFVGRIMDDNQLTLPNFGVGTLSGFADMCYNPTTGKINNDPNTCPLVDSAFSAGAGTGGVYDPNLKPSFSNQQSIGFTQKVWRNTSVDVTYERRMQHNLFEDYCGYYVPNSNPNVPGTYHYEISPTQCIITNSPGADLGLTNVLRSQYHGLITKVESRPYSWLDVVASWTHAQSKGSTESTQNQNTNFDFYPFFFNNYYGYLSDDVRNRVKLNGYVRFPLDFTLGVGQYWDDGLPWTPFQSSSTFSATHYVAPPGYNTINTFLEPRGDRRLPSFSQTDLQLQKDFRFNNVKFGVIGSVFNVFNKETPIGVNGNAGSRAITDPSTGQVFIGTGTTSTGAPYQQAGVNRVAATFGLANSWQRPRRYEAGIRFEF